MFRLMVLILVIAQLGCAHARLSCDETCGLRDMICVGETVGSASGESYGSGGPRTHTTNSIDTQCRKPSGGDEIKLAESHSDSAEEKIAHVKRTNGITIGAVVLGILLLGILTYHP